MRSTIFAVFLIALVSAPSVYARSVEVMSYNILNRLLSDVKGYGDPWDSRKKLVLDLIVETDPDIIGFQEDDPQQSLDLEGGLTGYGTVRFPIETIVPDKSHRAFFFKVSKFTLLDNGFFQQLDGGQRNATWIKLQKNDTGTVFYVFNAHWNGVSDPSGLLGHKLQAIKTQQVISSITSGEPVIFTGDLNSLNQTDPAIEYLTKPLGTLQDFTYPSGFRKFNTPGTWVVVQNGSDDSETSVTVDYVLTTDEIKFFNPRKIQKKSSDLSVSASDHQAVVQSIVLPGEKDIIITPLLHYLFDN